MTDPTNDPTDAGLADEIGDLGNGEPVSDPDAEGGYGVPAGADTNWVDPDADQNTDLMRADSDPLPDAQVPGEGPDGAAPTTPQL